jgi:hypothetical protein
MQFNISFYLHLGLEVVSLLHVPLKPLYAYSAAHYVPHAPPISSSLILSPQLYLISNTNYAAPQRAILPVSCYLLHLRPNNYILLSTPFSNIRNLPSLWQTKPHTYTNHRHNYSSVHFRYRVFQSQTRRHDKINILDQIAAHSPLTERDLNLVGM